MRNCKEYELDDVLAITAIPLDNIPVTGADSVANRLTPVISDEDFSPALVNSITIGLLSATIPIVRKSGKAKDDESDSVAGRLHTVNVTCEVDERDDSIWEPLLILERTPHHLLLTFRNNTRAFVSSSADTYICTAERDGAKTSVAFKIQNLMGIQPLV